MGKVLYPPPSSHPQDSYFKPCCPRYPSNGWKYILYVYISCVWWSEDNCIHHMLVIRGWPCLSILVPLPCLRHRISFSPATSFAGPQCLQNGNISPVGLLGLQVFQPHVQVLHGLWTFELKPTCLYLLNHPPAPQNTLFWIYTLLQDLLVSCPFLSLTCFSFTMLISSTKKALV